ncbi:MAG: alpha/beta hydrolase [Sphingomonas sp.]|nr:MAG: alpha/beta hydrolase [Sphingomonas sp.]
MARALATQPLSDPLWMVAPELREMARRTIASSAGSPPLDQNYLRIRRRIEESAAPFGAAVPVREVMVPSGAGAAVRAFIINARAGERRPVIVHAHGGGFLFGNARAEVAGKQALASMLDCVVVTVDYRLAPEATYAASIEDNYTVLRWVHSQAETIGIDRSRIAVMGESAGGGHAALLAITARDRGEVPLVLQVLIYPMLDDRTGSGVEPPAHVGTIGWSVADNRFGWRSFLGMAPGGADVPVAAVPARTKDLAGLPAAFIGVGAIDLFVDEDIAFARRLVDAGVPTELMVVPGAFHGFDNGNSAAARAFGAAKIAAIRRAFTPTSA